MQPDIQDYAIIGDCETAALVAKNGSIDWLCWPRFDSGACFAALLGDAENGRWKIAPSAPTQVRRRYRQGTLILETEFETETGAATLIDFMPLRGRNSDLIRIVRGDRGHVDFQMELVVRFDYGRSVPWVTRRDDGALVAVAGPDMVVLRTSVPLEGRNFRTTSQFSVNAGESVSFELTYHASNGSVPASVDVERSLKSTEEWWRKWIRRCSYNGPWKEAVERSLITLKALTYRPTGGILAAVTTSLPEEIGGERNWDYRFCWLRDATFTLLALMEAGFYQEAREWSAWLVRAIAGSPEQVQIMYGAAGERELWEWEIPWLTGFKSASPVRIGNAAAGQFQLDIYGEVADALHHAHNGKLGKDKSSVELQRALIEHLENIWKKPDEGIWEIRGQRRCFTYSKVMAWVAFDRTIKCFRELGVEFPLRRWSTIRQEIHDEVCRRGFNTKLGSFVESYDSERVDASLLLMPAVGFLPASDPRIAGTVRQIEKTLLWDGLVRRYDTVTMQDGLPPGEGAFLACSFWLADAYVMLGRVPEAERLLLDLLALRNDVGLLAEEYHPEQKVFTGNFPQAFSHVALINTVFNVTRGLGPAGKRTYPEPQ